MTQRVRSMPLFIEESRNTNTHALAFFFNGMINKIVICGSQEKDRKHKNSNWSSPRISCFVDLTLE